MSILTADSSLAELLVTQTPVDLKCTLLTSTVEQSGVIEICGSHGAGKSLVALHVAASLSLPREFGGRSAHVVVFDLDHKFSIHLFRTISNGIMKRYISGSPHAIDTSSADVLAESMRRTSVVHCSTELELFAALRAIRESYRHIRGPKVVLIENLSALYWQAKADGDTGAALQAASARAIRDLVRECGVLVLATKPPIAAASAGEQRDYTARAWQVLVRSRLYVSRAPPPGSTYTLRDRADRTATAAHFVIEDDGLHFL